MPDSLRGRVNDKYTVNSRSDGRIGGLGACCSGRGNGHRESTCAEWSRSLEA